MATAIETVASRQFTLRSLLLLTTAGAILAAVGTWAGRGWSLVLIGVFVALANYLGTLTVIQQPRVAQVVLYLAMIPYAIAFFLPTAVLWSPATGRDAELSGWSAIYQITTENVPSALRFPEGLRWRDWLMVAGFLIALTSNLAMMGLPWVAHRIVRGEMNGYASVLTFTPLLAWLGRLASVELYSGYYLWAAAMTVPLVVLPLQGRRFAVLLIAVVASAAILHCRYI